LSDDRVLHDHRSPVNTASVVRLRFSDRFEVDLKAPLKPEIRRLW
jgi:hypothetical protein